MGHICDGRVSLVVGTHTHVPTADHQILPGGTAYQTDAGMCGDYDCVIGMDKDVPIQRFTRKLPTDRLQPARARPRSAPCSWRPTTRPASPAAYRPCASPAGWSPCPKGLTGTTVAAAILPYCGTS